MEVSFKHQIQLMANVKIKLVIELKSSVKWKLSKDVTYIDILMKITD